MSEHLAQGPHSLPVDQRLLDELTLIASNAAAAILSLQGPTLRTREKSDRSPVTAADDAADRIIMAGLSQLMPGVPIVSEESATRPAPDSLDKVFVLVDPLDGTRDFIAGGREYTVNIAVIANRSPVAGVIAAPALGELWRGCINLGAEKVKFTAGTNPADTGRTPIHTRPKPTTGMVALTSRSHPDAMTRAYLDKFPGVQAVSCGSSLKFCRIAEGGADIYPRLTSLSEWDVAAGHAILAAAGGAMTTIEGLPITYGHAGFRVPPFVASG